MPISKKLISYRYTQKGMETVENLQHKTTI